MIIINADENGLGKPKWKRNINLRNAVKMAVAPHLLIPKKHLNFKNAVKLAVAPHTLLLQKHSRHQPRARQPRQLQVKTPYYGYNKPASSIAESYVGQDDLGLGKAKKPKKGFRKLVRKVNLKNTLKVVKFAGPLVAGIIPGGGTAMKVLDSKVGKTVMKVAKSKLVKKGVRLAKSNVGRAIVNQARQKIEGVNEIEPRGFSETIGMESTSNNVAESQTEPVGELTPVKEVEAVAKKDNTMLYAIGAVVVVGGIYMATKK
jgi:hypothetical protein